jgi:hypothetical protein
MSEPLDLGATELDEDRAREEHDLDRPAEFDRRTGVDERTGTRASLLPEEEAAGGSADPEAQAREVLRDSEVRTEVPGAAPDTVAERRPSGP